MLCFRSDPRLMLARDWRLRDLRLWPFPPIPIATKAFSERSGAKTTSFFIPLYLEPATKLDLLMSLSSPPRRAKKNS